MKQKNLKIRTLGIIAFLFLYAFGLPLLKTIGLLPISWIVTWIPALLPIMFISSLLLLAIPYFICIFILEILYDFYPDKVERN